MATLQKFKLLAIQCAVVTGSPTRSPTTSPGIHLRHRRRKTLRMFLNRSSSQRIPRTDDDSPDLESPEKSKEQLVVSHKLRDLFVSSPPPPLDDGVSGEVRDGFLPATRYASGGGGNGSGFRRGWTRSLRPLSATFRQRLLRRAWRPVLVSIPE